MRCQILVKQETSHRDVFGTFLKQFIKSLKLISMFVYKFLHQPCTSAVELVGSRNLDTTTLGQTNPSLILLKADTCWD